MLIFFDMRNSNGFTIVELLVVIVIIGILAAVSIVSYTGINNKAIVASIKSDLASAVTQLKLFKSEFDTYPSSVSNCAISPDTTTNKCIKLSGDNLIDGYSWTSNSFALRIKNGTNIYVATESSPPGEVAPITSIGNITGTTKTFATLTAGAIIPAEANGSIDYQWQSSSDGSNYTNIGTNSSTYSVSYNELNKYIRVIATGKGSYYGNVTSNRIGLITSDWYQGRAGTALEGKYVYYQNSTPSAYGPVDVDCPSPQCRYNWYGSGGRELVEDNSINFSQYPARNVCKAIGGRLPHYNEIPELYNGQNSYGNNFGGGIFWSSFEEVAGENSTYSYYADGYNLTYGNYVWGEGKTIVHNIRCVR